MIKKSNVQKKQQKFKTFSMQTFKCQTLSMTMFDFSKIDTSTGNFGFRKTNQKQQRKHDENAYKNKQTIKQTKSMHTQIMSTF